MFYTGHPNHIATYNGVKYALSHIHSLPEYNNRVKGYSLHTPHITHKFCGILNIIPIILLSDIVIVNVNIYTIYRALYAHRTQLVWYRILFVLFSSCSYINSFIEIDTS